MVAYALVREIPTIAGTMLAMVSLLRGHDSVAWGIGAIIAPAVVTSLARSRPPEPLS
jgi:hypothetical protein